MVEIRNKPSKRRRGNPPSAENPEDLDMEEPGTWEALAGLWPLEDRPEVFKNKAWVNRQSLDTVLKAQEAFERKRRELHTGSRHQTDTKPATVMIKGGPDNCFDQLNEARFKLRMPLAPWEDWWAYMPTERPERYKSIDLKSPGAESQIPKATIAK